MPMTTLVQKVEMITLMHEMVMITRIHDDDDHFHT